MNLRNLWMRMTEELVSRIEGIVRVHNDMEVGRTWEWRPDWEIKEEIEDRLWWSPFVDENRVSVSVEDDIITLIGVRAPRFLPHSGMRPTAPASSNQ